MKICIAMLSFAALCTAGTLTCPPDLTTDGVSVAADCPGLGAQVFALPSSRWDIYWNDAGPDNDIDDLAAHVRENNTGTEAVVTWIGGLAADDDALYVGTQYLFSDLDHSLPKIITTIPDAVIPFDLHDGADTFYMGIGTNGDGKTHDVAQGQASPVPEPSEFLGVAGALLILGFTRKGRKA